MILINICLLLHEQFQHLSMKVHELGAFFGQHCMCACELTYPRCELHIWPNTCDVHPILLFQLITTMHKVLYHTCRKIRWAKHSWFQANKVYHGNTFTVPWPAVFNI